MENIPEGKISDILENTYFVGPSDGNTVWSISFSAKERQMMEIELAFLYHLPSLNV